MDADREQPGRQGPVGEGSPLRVDGSVPRPGWVFLVMVVLGLLDRGLLILRVGAEWVSGDDAIYWQAVVDYGSGRFHEPYFYGQDYTVMTEALVAVPLHLLGVPVRYALPAVTALLSLLPFWSFGWWALRRGQVLGGVAIALMPVLLPVTFGLMTSLPRGFVGGVALLAAWPWCVSLASPWLRGGAVGAVATFAMVLNPNAMVFVAPALLLFLWAHRRAWHVMAACAVGTVPALAAWGAARAYYSAHPERVLHTIDAWMLDFHAEGIPEALARLDEHLAWLMPVVPGAGPLLPLLIAAISVHLLRRGERMAGCTGLLALAILTWSFRHAKVHDGIDHPFFPLSRMFLALPLVLIWWGTMALASARPLQQARRWVLVMLLIGAGFAGVKGTTTSRIVDHWLADQHRSPVQAISVDHVRAACGTIARAAADAGAGSVVFLKRPDHHLSYVLCYTCELLDPATPTTIGMGFDRRYWRRALLAEIPTAPVLVVGDPDDAPMVDTIATLLGHAGPSGPAIRLLAPGEAPLGAQVDALGP